MSEPSSIVSLRPPRRLGARLLRAFATSCGVVAAAAAGAYIASHVVAPLHAKATADTSTGTASFPCDSNGVTVGYDLTYSQALGSFAVAAVRVVGIDSACNGGPIQVVLGGSNGTALDGATASATVTGASMRLPLSRAVPAAQVGMVEVALANVTRSANTGIPAPAPATTTAPRTTTAPTTTVVPPTVTVAAPPSLCSTVSGFTSAVGTSGNCGAVVAPPAPTAATPTAGAPAPAAAVVSWKQNTFSLPVTVSLVVPAQPVVPQANFSAGSFVQLQVKDAAGAPVTQFAAPLAIDFPAPSKDYVPLYSEDGIHWETVPKLATDELPDGEPDGYFVHADGSITILTRHATVWALALPPTSVGRVKATPLPSGTVRLGWHGALAGLGLEGYQVFREGHLVATVRTTRTTVGLGAARSATFKVRAVDRAGQLGPFSPAVRARARAVTAVGRPAARLTGRTVVVTAQVRLDAAARVSASIRAADGTPVPLLAGSSLGGRPGAGASVSASAGAGVVRVTLRVSRSALHRGAPYTLRVGVVVRGRTAPPLAETFAGP
jgi:hypothetical protein